MFLYRSPTVEVMRCLCGLMSDPGIACEVEVQSLNIIVGAMFVRWSNIPTKSIHGYGLGKVNQADVK
jgi:hypothetical protein